jgi:hypothetical protein
LQFSADAAELGWDVSYKEAMRKIPLYWLNIAAAVAFLSVGIPFWVIPYGKLNVPDGLYGVGLAVIFISAVVLRGLGVASFPRIMNVLAATVPAAVMARIVVEGFLDPTKHNLWPLVMIIAAVVGYAVAVPGTLIGHWLGRFRSGRAER